MFKRMIVVAAVAAGSLALTTCAHAAGRDYELKRIPMGPRPDHYVLVRADRHKPLGAPDTVAGPQRQKTELRLVQRWAGPHYIGPVWCATSVRMTDSADHGRCWTRSFIKREP